MSVQRIRLLTNIGIHKAGDIVHVHLNDIRRLKLRNHNKHFPAPPESPATHDAFGTFPVSPEETHLSDVPDVTVRLMRAVALHKAGDKIGVSSVNLQRLNLKSGHDYLPIMSETPPLDSQCPLHYLEDTKPIVVPPAEPPAENSGTTSPSPANPPV